MPWNEITRKQYSRKTERYESVLTDAGWTLPDPLLHTVLPAWSFPSGGSARRGERDRLHALDRVQLAGMTDGLSGVYDSSELFPRVVPVGGPGAGLRLFYDARAAPVGA